MVAPDDVVYDLSAEDFLSLLHEAVDDFGEPYSNCRTLPAGSGVAFMCAPGIWAGMLPDGHSQLLLLYSSFTAVNSILNIEQHQKFAAHAAEIYNHNSIFYDGSRIVLQRPYKLSRGVTPASICLQMRSFFISANHMYDMFRRCIAHSISGEEIECAFEKKPDNLVVPMKNICKPDGEGGFVTECCVPGEMIEEKSA